MAHGGVAHVLAVQASQRTLSTEQWAGVVLGTVFLLGFVTVLILRRSPAPPRPDATAPPADHVVTPAATAQSLEVTMISAEVMALREVTLRDLSDQFLTTFTRLALETVGEVDKHCQASQVTHPRLRHCVRFIRAITLYRVELLHETPYDHRDARDALLDLPADDFAGHSQAFFNALHARARADFFVIVQTATGNLDHIAQLQAQYDEALRAELLPPERITDLLEASAEKALGLIRSVPQIRRSLADEQILERYRDRRQRAASA